MNIRSVISAVIAGAILVAAVAIVSKLAYTYWIGMPLS